MKTANEQKQKKLADSVLVIALLSAVFGLAGCEKEGTAEKAGKEIDRAAESTGQKIEQTTETVEQKAEQVTEKAEKKIEGATESVTDKAETAGQYIDDSVITTKVKAAILSNPFLGASHIDVTTVNGVVKLSGTVDSEPSISKAIEVAKGQENVKSVESSLVVKIMPDKK